MREHSHCPPFVVPDGRFREQYRGFIESELFDTMKNTLENFMGEIQNFGFVSNGSRIYYLNHSQPPLFIHLDLFCRDVLPARTPNGIIPDELLLSSQNAFGFVAALNMVLNRTNGTFPGCPPTCGPYHVAPTPVHRPRGPPRAPFNYHKQPAPDSQHTQSTLDLIPSGQIGVSEDALLAQAIAPGKNASYKLDGTVVEGGNKTDGEGWAATLRRELANCYVASALCSWNATGGETQTSFNTGYEKLSFSDIDSTGRGGEYTVQAGFGRTNGAILWVASIFNDKLAALKCPDVLQSAAATSGPTSTGGSGSNAASSARAPAAFVAAFALFAALAML
ncbi:trehalase-domain-containing protein [Dichomitus squalens]|uniref:alpha,alpha-trehalase n=1 Tax=Dichomitus squalens TaxID=114155 RepID=A0A4Q9PC14_9APHY|nr:trehalase-domain-containing protein [Dichomitus squalens]